MGNTKFEGTFDGDGHRIYNVHINEGDRLYRSGFWVSVVNATLKNFKLLGNVSIDGNTTIGLVAGRATKSTISDIYVDSTIKFKKEPVGGINEHYAGAAEAMIQQASFQKYA